MPRLWPRVLLALAGLVLLGIGGAVLFAPHAFFASNGIALGDQPNLLSEIRAPGGLLLACAVGMLLGALRPRFTRDGLRLGAMVYGAYGISRLISLALDGMPSTSLVGALVIELVIAALCLLALARPEPWPEKSPEIEGMTASA